MSATMRPARFDAASRELTMTDVPVLVPLGCEKRHLDELVELVRTGRLDVSGSVSDLMPLEDVARGVERLVSKGGDPVRLVVQPWA